MTFGYEILGGAVPDGRALVVRLLDVRAPVEKKLGRAGGLAMTLVPGTITNRAYDELGKKLAAELAKEGLVADVRVVDQAPKGPRPRADLVTGIAVGAGSVGILWLVRGLVWPWVRGLLGGR